VWLVNPKWPTVTVYRGTTDIQVLPQAHTLADAALLFGLSPAVRRILDPER
jgi:hypothetical protein